MTPRKNAHSMRFLRLFAACSVLTLAPYPVLAAQAPILVGTTTPQAAPTGKIELLTAGTSVPVHLVSPLSSATAQVGDTFSFATTKEIDVDGRVVIANEAQGQGEVVSVTKASGSGRSGALQIKYAWVYAADGGKTRLSDTVDSRAEDDRHGASSTATIVGFATFGVGGLFAHNFAHGHDMVIDDKKPLTAFVSDTVHVATTEAATLAEAGFDH
jgi:hypothetical protein